MRQHYTAEQLAASAAAGDPREESEFSDRAAFQRWQDEWFSVVTMGETLPQVGDPNRAKRWKATRRQRNAIETQRQLMEAPRAEPPRPLDETSITTRTQTGGSGRRGPPTRRSRSTASV